MFQLCERRLQGDSLIGDDFGSKERMPLTPTPICASDEIEVKEINRWNNR